MKRKWTYLGAFFPLSVAVAMAAEAASLTDDGTSNLMRSKTGTPQEDPNDKALSAQDGPDDGAAPHLRPPSAGQSAEDVARSATHDSPNLSIPRGTPDVHVSVPNTDGSMFAAASGPAPHSFAGSGGGGGAMSTSMKLVEAEEDDPGGTDPENPPPEDTGTVEPEPDPDADAMMILLGGNAEGAGEGATSAGQTLLDIVDYGDVTIGYGRAVYMATGSEEADADTFLEVAGADVVYSYEVETDEGGTASSAIYVVAVDFEGDPEEHPELSNLDWLQLLLSHGPFEQWLENEDNDHIDIDGNTALFSASAEGPDAGAPPSAQHAVHSIENAGSSALIVLEGESAMLTLLGESQGVDTFVSADGLLELDDQFSSVSGVLVGIA
jgi:hypothetical protein